MASRQVVVVVVILVAVVFGEALCGLRYLTLLYVAPSFSGSGSDGSGGCSTSMTECEILWTNGVTAPVRRVPGLDYDNIATCCNDNEIFNCRICCGDCFYVGNSTSHGTVLEGHTNQFSTQKVDARLNKFDCMTPGNLRDAISGLSVWFVGDSIMRNSFFTFASHMTDDGAMGLPRFTKVRSPNVKFQKGHGGLLYLDDLVVAGNHSSPATAEYLHINSSTYGLPNSSHLRYFPTPTLLPKVPKFNLFWGLLEQQIALHRVNILITDAPDLHSSQNPAQIKSMTEFLMAWGRRLSQNYGCQLILTGFPIQQVHKKPKYASKQTRDWSIGVFNEVLRGVSECNNATDCKSAPVLIEMSSLADAPRHGDTTLDGTHRYPFGITQHLYALALGMKWYKQQQQQDQHQPTEVVNTTTTIRPRRERVDEKAPATVHPIDSLSPTSKTNISNAPPSLSIEKK